MTNYEGSEIIPFSYVDKNLNLSYQYAGVLVSDAVTGFFESNGIDNSSIANTYNSLWIVLKNKIHFNIIPKYKDKIRYEVKLVEVKKLYIVLEVKFFDTLTLLFQSNVLCSLIDTYTHEIKDIDVLSEIVSFEKKLSLIKFDRFKNNIDGYTICDEYISKNMDIDFSNHVNNLVYIKWVLESLPDDILDRLLINDFEIHYLKEIKKGSKVKILFKESLNLIEFIVYTNTINAKGKIYYALG